MRNHVTQTYAGGGAAGGANARFVRWAATVVGVMLMAFASLNPAHAQEKKKVRSATGRKVIQLDALKVEGRIQKPEAMLVFNRSPMRDDETLKAPERFADKIPETLEDDSF